MKTSLMALAITAAAGAANAQSTVTLSGVVDMAMTRGSASGIGSTALTSMTSGGNSTSKLVFRASEDLGGGLVASFHLEGQLYTDSGIAGRAVPAGNQSITTAMGTGLTFTRRSTVSLAGRYGEVRLGRDFTPSLYNLSNMDPFVNVGVGTSIVVLGASNGLNAGGAFSLVPAGQGTNGPLTRASNQFSYFLPRTLGGLYGQASYWLGENVKNGAVNQDDGTGAGLRVGYQTGPFDVQAGYSKTKYRGTPVATTAGAASGDFQSWNIGTSWNFGVAKVMAHYSNEQRRSTVRAEGQGWLIGASAPLGVHELRASFGRYRVDGGPGRDPSTSQVSVGDVYNLSKRTALYATLSRVSNSNGARIALGGSTIGAGLGDAKSTGFDLGLRHAF